MPYPDQSSLPGAAKSTVDEIETGASDYELETLNISPEEWNSLIKPYSTTLVYHRSHWLDYLERSHNGRRVLLACKSGALTVGYFCGMTIRKGPFRILGAPFRGWWTANMGPIADPTGFNTAGFLAALDRYCRKHRIDFLELCCDWLDQQELIRAGFTAGDDVTHSMPLGKPEESWMRMFKTTRNYVRRAEKNGVRIEVAADEGIIRDFYEQLKAIFDKQNLKPSHPIEWLLNMWRCVQPAGDLIGLRALDGDRCIATYILACDDHTMWGLATASWPDALDVRPNELIHWRAIEMACLRGLQRYDFCGGGSYKKKYGAEEMPRIHWQKAYSPAAYVAYRFYVTLWSGLRKLTQKARRWTKRAEAGRFKPIQENE